MMTRNAPAWIGISVLLAAAAYLAVPVGMETSATPAAVNSRLAGAVALLIVVAGAAGFGYRPTVHIALRQALAWLTVALVGVILYTHRAEIEQVAGPFIAEALQQAPVVAHEVRDEPDDDSLSRSAVAISAGRGGHFFVEAMVNGRHVSMVADTGATLVALTAEDAARIGLRPSSLRFVYKVRTANGVARAAHVTLDEVTIGRITIYDVAASVSEPGALNESLLGMSFLKRLSSFQVRGDLLLLEQ